MNVVYDSPNPADTDVDIGMVFALSTGYRASPETFGVRGAPQTAEFQAGLLKLYTHGKLMGKLNRVAASGKQTPWVLPTEGRWPTVAEMRRRFVSSPPDTRWMTGARPDLSFYTDHHRAAGGGARNGVEEFSLADCAFEHDAFASDAQ